MFLRVTKNRKLWTAMTAFVSFVLALLLIFQFLNSHLFSSLFLSFFFSLFLHFFLLLFSFYSFSFVFFFLFVISFLPSFPFYKISRFHFYLLFYFINHFLLFCLQELTKYKILNSLILLNHSIYSVTRMDTGNHPNKYKI